MANTRVQLRRTAVAGRAANSTYINAGELGLNMADQILYSMDATNTVFIIGANVVNQLVTNSISINAAAVGTIPFSVKAVPSATANILQVSNSGSVVFAVNSSGVLVGNGFGITSVTASIVANSGIVSNATGIFANIGTGLSFVSGAITATATGGSPFGQI